MLGRLVGGFRSARSTLVDTAPVDVYRHAEQRSSEQSRSALATVDCSPCVSMIAEVESDMALGSERRDRSAAESDVVVEDERETPGRASSPVATTAARSGDRSIESSGMDSTLHVLAAWAAVANRTVDPGERPSSKAGGWTA